MLRTLAAAGGIILVGLAPILPPAWVLIPLLSLAALLCLIPSQRTLAAFMAGLGWGLAGGHLLLQQQLAPALQGRDIAVSGEIVGLPQVRERGQLFWFRPAAGAAVALPELLRLSWFTERELGAGARCELTVRLKPPRGLSNPGGFDYHTWLVSQGIGATGYVRDNPFNHCASAAFSLSVGYWRQYLSHFLARVSDRHRHAGFLRALAIGDRQGITQFEWEVLRRTGTQHLMAISGLHIGLVATLGYAAGGLLGRGLLLLLPLSGAVRYAAVAGSFTLAGIYAALAGFSLPTQRALLMVVLVHICLLRRRPVPIFHILALTLLLVLILSPLAAHSPGFWLSFGAVATLLLGFCGRRLAATAAGWRYLRQTVWSQWVILIGLLVPLSCFGMPAAPLAPIANTLAIPAVSWLVVPALLLGCLLSDIAPGLSQVALWWSDSAFDWVWRYLLWIDRLAPPSPAPATTPMILALALAGGLVLLGPRYMPVKWLGLCCLLPLFFPRIGTEPHLRITVLDVGQGLAAVVTTPAHTLVYDTGPGYGGRFNAGRDIVAPYLRRQRIRFIDRLIISHGDTDHSGGAGALVDEVNTGLILTGEPSAIRPAGLEPCVSGQTWVWEEVRFTLLAPAVSWHEPVGSGNERSCVLLVEYGDDRILLPGDIGAGTEARLPAEEYRPLTLLVAPHHGSITSSSPRWVELLQPAFVVFSAGYRNRYGHPHPRVTSRYRHSGAVLLNTAVAGAVEFIWHADAPLEVIQHRRRQRRYWFTDEP